ncbi:MAG: carboxypeptidase regulatory-like domain-containing protein [Bacteroidales bacterium]|nr:carboxypeptidase regulatory-like domain-containing protein [Bacteroidales bacterium]
MRVLRSGRFKVPVFHALSIVIISLLLHLTAGADIQNDSLATIRGRVTRTEQSAGKDFTGGVPGAVVQLFYHKENKTDSLYTYTNRSGEFSFLNIVPQRIGLKIQSMGLKTITGVYDIEPGANLFYFNMQERIEELTGATVSAEIPLIRQIQDTTIFNTKVVKTLKDDDLRQLIETLPGFVVTNDAIFVDGRQVSRTYVNGTLVFGDKVTTALDALKADEVTQVRVYDELSDIDKHRGIKNARKNRVLDIVTKDPVISLASASAAVAGGADCTGQFRYATAGIAQFHSEMFQAQAILDCSNLKGAGAFEGRSLNASSLVAQPDPLDSYKESQFIRIQGTKYWKERYYGNSVNFFYQMAHEQSRSASTAINEYFGLDANPAMSMYDTLANFSNIMNHMGSVSLQFNDTPLKSFGIELSGSYDANRFDSFQGNLTLTDQMPDIRTHQDSGSDGKDYSAGLGIKWTNNDAKRFRPYVEVEGGISNNNSISWSVDTLGTSYLNRFLTSDGIGKGANAILQVGLETTLVNTNDKTGMLTLKFNSRYDYSKRRQLSYDEYGVDTPVMNIANSYDFTHNQLSNSVDACFSLSTITDRSLFVKASLTDALLFSSEHLPVDFDNNKHYPSFTGDVRYYSPKWSITASSAAVTPSIEQIRKRVSDANPLVLTAGNPDLRQGYNISINTDYRLPVRQNGAGRNSSLVLTAGLGVYFRPIVSRVRYFNDATILSEYDGYEARAGSILNTFDNSKEPRFNVSGKVTYSKNIVRHGLKLDFSLSDNYLRSPMYYGEALSAMDENALQISLLLAYTPSSRIKVTNRFSSAYLASSRNGDTLSERIHLSDSFLLRWFITKWLKLDVNYTLSSYHYVSGAGQDHFQHVLNTGISAPLSREFEISIWGYDILNSGSLYTTEVTSAMMSQTWTPTYGRNIMLKLAYRFRVKQ